MGFVLQRDLQDLTSNRFDVVVIGGGITGAFLALEIASLGLSVALIEKGDFGAATSSASSKLLHGGIRYLQQGLLHKVRESAFERVRFQNLAPHLCCYVPFIVPAYRGLRKSKALLRAGMYVYEAICLGQNRQLRDRSRYVPRSRSISRDEMRALLPNFPHDHVTGGIVLYESHMYSSERMTLAVLESAAGHGAVLANYVRAESLLNGGKRVFGVRAVNVMDGTHLEIRASLVVNASGPWIPHFNKAAMNRRLNRVVTTHFKGAHIVTRPLTAGHAIVLPTQRGNQGMIGRGGRHIFVIPWREHSLIGTTYGPFNGDLDDVRTSEDDIAALIEDVNGAFGAPILDRSDVLYAYAGLYPLVADVVNPLVYQGTGKYQIVDHSRADGVEGMVSVFGAKFTTARLLAERAMTVIACKLKRNLGKCQTRETALVAGAVGNLEDYRKAKKREYGHRLPEVIIDHLITNYGANLDRVVRLVNSDPALGRRVVPQQNVIVAEIRHAVEHEMAMHLEDFVFRRTGLGTLGNPGREVLVRCADMMGNLLGWDYKAREAEIERTLARFTV